MRTIEKMHVPSVDEIKSMTADELHRILNEAISKNGELEKKYYEQERGQEALELSKARYAALYDFAPSGYATLDRDGTLLELNMTMAKQLREERDQLVGKSFAEFITAESQSQFRHHLSVVFDSKIRHTCEIVLIRKDGTKFNAQLESLAVQGEDWKLSQTKTVIQDITEQKKTEEELQKSQKLESLRTLVSGIAHDYNNLLSAVMGNIDLATESGMLSGESLHYLHKAKESGRRIQQLTKQLLFFSEKMEPELVTCDLQSLVREAVTFSLSGSNISATFTFEDSISEFLADEDQIRQAIIHIVTNAIEASRDGGAITVTVKQVEDPAQSASDTEKYCALIKIADKGAGIPQEILGNIFDPFFSTKPKRAGLGLTVAYGIALSHGGDITVSSAPHEGTTISIILPFAPSAPKHKYTPRTITRQGKILFMDDEEVITSMAERMLNRVGYDIITAENGEEAVALFKDAYESDKPFDLVILDLTIQGGMGGDKAIQVIREIDPGVPAIVSSGYVNNPVLKSYKSHGFESVLLKPYDAHELRNTVNDVLSSK